MGVQLSHINWTKDKWASAEFLAHVLGLRAGPQWGHFVPVRTSNGVTIDLSRVPAGPLTMLSSFSQYQPYQLRKISRARSSLPGKVAIDGCFSYSCRVCNIAHAGPIDSSSGKQTRRLPHERGSSGVGLFVEDLHA